VGKHSARDGQDGRDNRTPHTGGTFAPPGTALGTPGSGRRRRDGGDPFADSGTFVAIDPQDLRGRAPGRPEHREHGAWGTPGGWTPAGSRDLPFDPVEDWAEGWAAHDTATAAAAAGLRAPRHQAQAPGRAVPRPRQEFLDAFESPRPSTPEPAPAAAPPDDTEPGGRRKGGKAAGWTISGIAAAAVVTVAAVAAGGQLTGAARKHLAPGPTPDTPTRSAADEASRSQPRETADATPTVAPLSYEQLMDRQYPLDPALRLSGAFETVPGRQAAPGKGKVMTFRVDVEKGLPLDSRLFSDTVFKTLNDSRSWGHGGTMTFERVSSGHADIVVTLASPGTTAKWCAKSGLDTTVENVSCDAASTPRTMINAFRWAQGAETYGPELMHAYRQMLINHEVGHRLGHGHVGCPQAGAPAPVMMQQTKFLSLNGGPTCKPNAWPFP
jgi:hypothetical protein